MSRSCTPVPVGNRCPSDDAPCEGRGNRNAVAPGRPPTRRRPLPALTLLTLLAPWLTELSPAQAQVAERLRPVTDNLVVRKNIRLRPGVYRLRDVDGDGIIRIEGDHITLDGTGVTILGEGFRGVGIAMNGHTGLTLRNFDVRGFDYGIRIENASDVTIVNSNISGNRKDTTTPFLNIGCDACYGGGILLRNVSSSTIRGNTLTNQSTGLEMIDSHHNLVLANTTSSPPAGNEAQQNSCWGVRLSGSTHNLVRGTIADYVDRERYGLVSGDSAGILLVSGSHDNRIASNSLVHSGDGFFLGNSCTRASHRNYVYGNDGSFSPHNAFECTFSDSNVFENNLASHSDYGFWLGYSYNTRVVGNEITDNRHSGIEIEHGRGNVIDHNSIDRNATGIRLYGDETCGDPDCGASCPSAAYQIHDNTLAFNTTGVAAAETHTLAILRNQFAGNGWNVRVGEAPSTDVDLVHNDLACTNPLTVPENLAFGKPATANQGAATAALAVDGEVFVAGAWTPPELGAGDYWQVDLGSTFRVAEIVIFPYHINPHDFPYQFHIDLSATGAFAGEEIRLVTETARPLEHMLVYTFAPREGRYLRLISDESPPRLWIRMQEFAAYSEGGHHPMPCQFSVSNDMPAGSDLPARRNSWGTTDGDEIAAVVYDQTDDPQKGAVLVDPFLLEPIPDSRAAKVSPAGWTATTPLPIASAAPFLDRGRQLIFADRRVYVFGGRNAGDERLNRVFFASLRPDGTLGAWTETTPLPELFYDHVVVRVGRRVYLISGAAGQTAVYFATLGSDGHLSPWTATAALSPSRQSFAAVAYGPYVYVTGGNSGGTRDFVQRSTVRADGHLEPWTDLPPLPKPIQSHVMVADGGYLYVLAADGEVYMSELHPDGSLGTWRPTTPLPAPRSGHAAFADQGHLYLLGGDREEVYRAAVGSNGQLREWRPETTAPEASLRALRVGAYNGYLYTVGGFTAPDSYSDAVRFVPLALADAIAGGPGIGSWTTGTPLPTASAAPFLDRGRQLVFHPRGWVYLFGGRSAAEQRMTEVVFAAVSADGTLGPWEQTTPLPQPFYDHVVVPVSGRVYLISGAAGATAVYFATLRDDGQLSAWTATTSLHPSRQSFAATAFGPHIYVTGGNSGGTRDFVKRSTVRADGHLEPWIDLAPLPKPIQGHTMAISGSYLYVLAPDGEVYVTDVRPDGDLGNWRLTTPMPAPRTSHATFAHQGHLYLLGGDRPEIYHAAVGIDGALGQWQLTRALPEGLRALRAGTFPNGYAYALGGFRPPDSYRDTAYAAPVGIGSDCPGGETVIPAFTEGPGGRSTQLDYEGLATIVVSGVGQASGRQFSDAFYIFADAEGRPISPHHPTAQYNWVLAINAQHAEELIVGGQVPPYRPDHRYTFRIVAPSGPLSFGVSDLYTADNTGHYTVTLCGGTPPGVSRREPPVVVPKEPHPRQKAAIPTSPAARTTGTRR